MGMVERLLKAEPRRFDIAGIAKLFQMQRLFDGNGYAAEGHGIAWSIPLVTLRNCRPALAAYRH